MNSAGAVLDPQTLNRLNLLARTRRQKKVWELRSPAMSRPKVLFLCTGNSCRSQMAEGFLRHYAADRFDAMSAGTRASTLNPTAVAVMREVGIDISGQHSKSVSEFMWTPLPCVITVCDNAKETCPNFPGISHKLHWSFQDPAAVEGSEEERLAVFRRVREEIAARIRAFVAEQSLG